MKIRQKIVFLSLLSLPSLTIINGCKKQLDIEGNSEISTRNDMTPRSNTPKLFFSYESNWQIRDGALASIDIATNMSNFNLQNLSDPRPNYHVINKVTNELLGVGSINGKDVLVKYNIQNKLTTTANIFSATNYVREIVQVNPAQKTQLFYLEGNTGETSFKRLIRSNIDGTEKTTLLETSNGIITAIVPLNNKIYYVDKTLNALVVKDLINNSTKVLIKNFNLAGVKQFADYKLVNVFKNNIWQWMWSAQRIERPIDERRLNLIGIDGNEVFWVKDVDITLPMILNEHPKNKYNQYRPALMKANAIDGSGITVLDDKLNFALGKYVANSPDAIISYYGNMQINSTEKKIVFGFEVVTDRNSFLSYKGNVTSNLLNPYKNRELKFVQVDFTGKNSKNLLTENGTNILYPPNFGTASNAPDWSNTDNIIFKGGLDCFILDSGITIVN